MAKGKEVTVTGGGTLERMPRSLFDIERLFDEFFNRRWLRPLSWERPVLEMPAMPSVDVIDRDDEVVVRAEVPGYDRDEIEISVSDSSVTIRGQTKTEEKEEKGDYYRCEISHGAFSRTIGLPAAVDDSKAKASLKDGILELTLPKLEKAKRRTITIS